MPKPAAAQLPSPAPGVLKQTTSDCDLPDAQKNLTAGEKVVHVAPNLAPAVCRHVGRLWRRGAGNVAPAELVVSWAAQIDAIVCVGGNGPVDINCHQRRRVAGHAQSECVGVYTNHWGQGRGDGRAGCRGGWAGRWLGPLAGMAACTQLAMCAEQTRCPMSMHIAGAR